MKNDKTYHFECIKCGKCCSDKNTIVNLTYTDILRMEYEKKYTLSDFLNFVGFYMFEEDPTEQQLKQMVVPPIQTENGGAFLGLRKQEDGRCIFLNKHNKCKIYKARPSICRTFPFNFHSIADKSGKKKIDIHMRYTEKSLEYCPGISDNSPEIIAEPWLKDGQQAVKEILSEHVLIKKWNTAVKEGKITASAENYLRIILNMTDKQKEPSKKPVSETAKKSYQSRLKKKLQQHISEKKK
ncbi:hypothetical protein NEF87_004645 [Candidatus Lokiarchaeum ossiferum]|uniref:YkgJ family cysteine cluster protein n=1 Tax=Candidatus Lokiarchaeum ossiferum TaxID=2951803 RepID=A0ABY6HXX0_9ARCH|nr:hypothetical protein NEF87_004645 [Candidatus Lokiarchaeum sp. B-35]